MFRLLLIFLGGGCGALLRHGLGTLVHRLTPVAAPGAPAHIGFPLGTLTVNLCGCLLIGILATRLTLDAGWREEYRLALVIGVLGGFTTFSSFGWETIQLLQAQRWPAALLYVGCSTVLGLAAAWLGHLAALRW